VPKNVRAIHELFREKDSLDRLYAKKKGKYQALKEALAEDMIKFIGPLRARRARLAKDPVAVREILKEGGARARARAAVKMRIVREKIGTEQFLAGTLS
jgi:tryptophanyl-tRNA synthetase